MVSRNQSVITAYHEAGHAVMAAASGFHVTEITNVPSELGMGYVRYNITQTRTEIIHKCHVLVLASGIAADYLHWQQLGLNNEENPQGYFSDLREAENILHGIGQSGFRDAYIGAAISFLKTRWAIVDEIATLLNACGGHIDGPVVFKRISENTPQFSETEFHLLDASIEMERRKQGK